MIIRISNSMSDRIESVQDLAIRAAQDDALAARIRSNPVEALAQLARPLQTDVWIYRIVVMVLGLAVLLTLTGAICLAAGGKPLPEGVIALGSAAAGALAGLLAPSPARS
jgi:hypothetical protein